MRCECCNKNLNDFEAVRKSKVSGEYLNMCNKCISEASIAATTREDLDPYDVPDDEIDFIDDDYMEDE